MQSENLFCFDLNYGQPFEANYYAYLDCINYKRINNKKCECESNGDKEKEYLCFECVELKK